MARIPFTAGRIDGHKCPKGGFQAFIWDALPFDVEPPLERLHTAMLPRLPEAVSSELHSS